MFNSLKVVKPHKNLKNYHYRTYFNHYFIAAKNPHSSLKIWKIIKKINLIENNREVLFIVYKRTVRIKSMCIKKTYRIIIKFH